MIELSGRTVIDQVVDRLAKMYLHVPSEKVADVVNTCYARFEGRPIRDVVRLFVEPGARDQLAQMIGSLPSAIGHGGARERLAKSVDEPVRFK